MKKVFQFAFGAVATNVGIAFAIHRTSGKPVDPNKELPVWQALHESLFNTKDVYKSFKPTVIEDPTRKELDRLLNTPEFKKIMEDTPEPQNIMSPSYNFLEVELNKKLDAKNLPLDAGTFKEFAREIGLKLKGIDFAPITQIRIARALGKNGDLSGCLLHLLAGNLAVINTGLVLSNDFADVEQVYYDAAKAMLEK